MPIQQVIADITAARAEALLIAGPVTPPPDPDPPPPDPVPTGPEDWRKLGTGGSTGAYFRRPVMLPNGDIWAAWSGSFIFNGTTRVWKNTAPAGQSGALYDIGNRENYGAWCDGNKVYIGNGGPVGYGFPPAPPPYPQWGDISFDLNTKTYTLDRDDPNALGKGDDAYLARAGVIYAFGGWTIGKQDLIRLEGGARVNVTGTSPPTWTQEQAKLTYSRAGIDSRSGMLWTLADNYELHTHDGKTTGKWVKVPTTGTRPPAYGSATLDEERNRIVVWIGGNHIVEAGHDVDVCETWALDLTTKVWSQLGTTTKPPATPQCQHNLLFNLATRACNLVIDTDTGTDVWELSGTTTTPPPVDPNPPPVDPPPPIPPPPPVTGTVGTITSTPLTAIQGAPFSSVMDCKHANASTDGVHIYVSGGDWVTSATDGTWRYTLDGTNPVQVHPGPTYPSNPAPHALQDGAGFEWFPLQGEFLLWPGSYLSYTPAGDPLRNYARAMHWFKPATSTYRQDLTLFDVPGSGSGSVQGDAFDHVTGEIVVMLDSGHGGNLVKLWNINTGTSRTLPLPITTMAGKPGAYFTNGQYCRIGRDVFFAGYSTDGNISGQVARLWKWNLDAHTLTDCALPPVPGPVVRELEARLAESNGKIVWLLHGGPEGLIDTIAVYDPVTNGWAVDSQARGPEFMGNCVCGGCPIPSDTTGRTRVALAGGVFGRQQTHFNFYEAA